MSESRPDCIGFGGEESLRGCLSCNFAGLAVSFRNILEWRRRAAESSLQVFLQALLAFVGHGSD